MIRRRGAVLLAVVLALVSCSCVARGRRGGASPGVPEIHLADVGGAAVIEVRGLDPERLARLGALPRDGIEWQRLLALRVDPGEDRDPGLPPAAGSYEAATDALRFTPRFPLAPGVAYRAEFSVSAFEALTSRGDKTIAASQPSHVDQTLEVRFRVPELAPGPRAVVERVYPSAPVLPENLLKLYLHFSQPMRHGDVYRHIHLIDRRGREVDLPFYEIGEELWDREGRRLTVFFDPARVKRGLVPHEEEGRALSAGETYSLLIDDSWLDARGQPLAAPFRKEFRAGPADYESPDPGAWKIAAPRARTRDALRVRFPEPLDHALLHRMLWIEDAAGDRVEGALSVSDGETSWSLTPERPWVEGEHALAVVTTLEDLAGNSVARPFEVDILTETPVPIAHDVERVAFRIEAVAGQ